MECDTSEAESPPLIHSSLRSEMPSSSSLPPRPRRSLLETAKWQGSVSVPLRQQNELVSGRISSNIEHASGHPKGLVQPLPARRTFSMPLSRKSAQQQSPTACREKETAQKVDRSVSFPSLRKMRSMLHQRSFPPEVFVIHPMSAHDLQADCGDSKCNNHQDQEEVSKEEAVCRICMLELHEGSETLQMECSCKGELALAHKDCAIKWFSIKGNSLCDICNNQVRNLPVVLFRRPSSLHWDDDFEVQDEAEDLEEDNSWHHAAVIILSSAMASLWHKLTELAEFP